MALEVEEGEIVEVEEGEIVEAEEGEIVDEYDDVRSKIDVDKAFSYMDERIERVLGNFRGNFEGVVSKQRLGPMYGGYGTFLPTYVRPRSTLLPEVEAKQSTKNVRPPPILFQEAETSNRYWSMKKQSLQFYSKNQMPIGAGA